MTGRRLLAIAVRHGLAFAQGAVLAVVEHDARRLLRRSAVGGAGSLRQACDFYTGQGSQFTSSDFTGVLQAHEVCICMDGRGRWLDDVFIERLWRSLKYEAIYLHEIADGFAA